MSRWGAVNRAKARRPKSQGLNRTEAAYARILQAAQAEGKILRFAFEAVRIKLAANCFYAPDFLVFPASGEVEIHEVKGSRGYQLDPQGRVKLKVAAALLPEFVFRGCVQRTKKAGGGFQIEEIKLPASWHPDNTQPRRTT